MSRLMKSLLVVPHSLFCALALQEILSNVFGDMDFQPYDYVYKVDEAVIESLRMHLEPFYDDGRTLANLLASQVLFQMMDHMSDKYRNFKRHFSKARSGAEDDLPRYAHTSGTRTLRQRH